MQLKLPPAPPDETMQLRLPEPGTFDLPEEQPKTGGRGRRKAPRPSVLARFTAAAGARLAPFAPFVSRMRPEYPRPGRTDWRRWVPSWRQSLGAAGLAVGASGMFLTVAYAATDIPADLNTFATQQDNVYFWSDGTPMARTGWVRRQAMPLKDVPEDVRWAVLAAENSSFYSDPGISFSGITRALVRTVGEGDTQGGSTITQQYVKNVYLSQDRSLGRKFDEAMIALKLDNQMSKDEILEGYLNTSWFGRGTYGIQRASQAYYGKDVSELNVSEAAALASLLKGAGLYDPSLSRANHARTVVRWEWILDRMVAIKKLSKAERAKYTKFPEPLDPSNQYDTGKQSDYLVELASQYAKKAANITAQEFDRGGYQIYTTFDKDRQTELTDAVTKARREVTEKNPKKAKTAHFGASSVDSKGRILAVYGGPDHRRQGYNESNATTVPSGSAFLPFVYAAGLEHGVVKERGGAATPVTPQTVYDGNDAVPVTTPEGPYWDRDGDRVSAHNDGKKSWGPISLHNALAGSVNTPFMQLGMDTGLAKVRKTAEAAGFLPSSFGAQVPAFSVGSATPSAIRMASGYSTFAAQGKHTEPYSVRKMTHNGYRVPLKTPGPERAVGADVAAEVTSALTDAFRTAHPDSPGAASYEVAAKGGTTQDDKAAWYVGTAANVSTAVVVYRIDLTKSLEPLRLGGIAGTPNSGVPYDIWSRAMSIG
ncbi:MULTISPECIES: transglycosylase domain-containing protein [Streptomyces]|uniref:transglycosylase domain-containing protein n=1 Tax=Streptomyces scabiei TaxID=1930 RepID=UPI0004E6C916|nr:MULTISPECIES: transglycosylase domain-containing protein [Streptomyces]KFG08203.1 penicillin-binding protein [Streptomyces scabiei]MBP5875374.1 penicillin-binding protein [Streptomyces sp. LBUM 1477]MBP5883196.1 penicillin-binding protein [Streptomyces sp. LBUM 1487]MBP5893984.1 penicillin-binding protein [Streptomyces sp. LBUM 1481]MBP5899218.1 penicillin-binding protein [Streptomyces sp. LBUM 1488]